MVELFDCTTIDLKRGSRGELVKRLQTYLKELGYYTTYNGHYLKIDGEYETYTVKAVQAFQRATGHTDDGWFGPKTCPDLNRLIQNKYGASATTPSSSSTTGTASKPTTVQQQHVIQNVYTAEQANLHIGGVHLIASTVTPTNHFTNGNWKYLELTNDKFHAYRGHSLQKEYSVECYLTHEQFVKLDYDLSLLCDEPKNVTSDLMITPGKYHISISVAEERIMEKKLTIKLVQYTGG